MKDKRKILLKMIEKSTVDIEEKLLGMEFSSPESLYASIFGDFTYHYCYHTSVKKWAGLSIERLFIVEVMHKSRSKTYIVFVFEYINSGGRPRYVMYEKPTKFNSFASALDYSESVARKLRSL